MTFDIGTHDEWSPSTMFVVENQRVVLRQPTTSSPATLGDEYDAVSLHRAVAEAFAEFPAVFVDDEGDALNVYAIADDHTDDAYTRLAAAEDRLARSKPGVPLLVHLRAARGREAHAVAPKGATQVLARR